MYKESSPLSGVPTSDLRGRHCLGGRVWARWLLSAEQNSAGETRRAVCVQPLSWSHTERCGVSVLMVELIRCFG